MDDIALRFRSLLHILLCTGFPAALDLIRILREAVIFRTGREHRRRQVAVPYIAHPGQVAHRRHGDKFGAAVIDAVVNKSVAQAGLPQRSGGNQVQRVLVAGLIVEGLERHQINHSSLVITETVRQPGGSEALPQARSRTGTASGPGAGTCTRTASRSGAGARTRSASRTGTRSCTGAASRSRAGACTGRDPGGCSILL